MYFINNLIKPDYSIDPYLYHHLIIKKYKILIYPPVSFLLHEHFLNCSNFWLNYIIGVKIGIVNVSMVIPVLTGAAAGEHTG